MHIYKNHSLRILSAFLAFYCLSGNSASAASGGYGSFIAARQIFQTNFIVRSQNWPVVGSPLLSSRITFISWNIGYTRPSKGTILIRVCRPSPMRCTGWSGLSGSTSIFNGENGVAPFFFESVVNFGSTVVLNPSVQPNGSSGINVNYEF